MVATPRPQAANPNGPTPGNTGFTCDGSGNNNIAQTDGIVVDVEFYSEQSRNNPNFRCTPQTGPTTATITVDKEVSFTSTTIVGVDVNDFTLTIDGPDAPLVVVDEVPAAGLTPGVYTVSEVYSNDPTGITYDAVFSGSCSEIGNTNTGTMTVVAGDNVTCNITNEVSPEQIPT
jgi:hypothetical protein